jgi:hypothetical protein
MRAPLFFLLMACSGKPSAAPDTVEERVVTERQPDGSIKKTTIRTTRHVVPAKPPPVRPADPYPADPLVRYNVERVNAYRAKKGVAPLAYDSAISSFAIRGSEQLASDHTPHAHFAASAKSSGVFPGAAAENQGDPGGVPSLDPDRARNGHRQIDTMLELMFAEGPGGGHYDNMMNARFRRIGVGLVYAGGKLYMTNDFSE